METEVALNIKNRETEELAAEVARMTGESKTEAIRRSLADRRERLERDRDEPDREERIRRFLAEEIWAVVPPEVLGKSISKQELEEILGYDEDGV